MSSSFLRRCESRGDALLFGLEFGRERGVLPDLLLEILDDPVVLGRLDAGDHIARGEKQHAHDDDRGADCRRPPQPLGPVRVHDLTASGPSRGQDAKQRAQYRHFGRTARIFSMAP